MPRSFARAAALTALLVCGPANVGAQQPPRSRALTILPPTGLPIIPVMEGWYENDDGSVTISFGYHNKNQTGTLVIPLGENNRLEPAMYDGAQPTFFDRGRHTGVFTVTLPAAARRDSVWWYIGTGENAVNKVPGRATSEAYQLDRRPRPQGSVPPLVWFSEDGPRSSGPDGITVTADEPLRVGVPTELTVHAAEVSKRDANDPRFQEPVPVWVNWAVHQGAAPVEFTRHESTVVAEPESDTSRARQPGLEDVVLKEGAGTAKVYATFREPGEYLLRIQVDNWAAPESSEDDQCCWTNVYQRITVVGAQR